MSYDKSQTRKNPFLFNDKFKLFLSNSSYFTLEVLHCDYFVNSLSRIDYHQATMNTSNKCESPVKYDLKNCLTQHSRWINNH
jgi:hypothetical protein